MTFLMQHKFKILGFLGALITVALVIWGAYEEYKVHYERCISKGGTLLIDEKTQAIKCKLPRQPEPTTTPDGRSWKWPWESD